MTIEQKVIDTFKKHDLDIVEVKGNSRFGKHMHAIWHDGVQYSIDYHGNMDKNDNPDIEHSVKHLKIMLNSEVYHQKIKKIYDYLMGLNIGDIWVMSGGGCQIQAFFGNKNGYVAILYLDMDNIKKPKQSNHTLQVNFAQNDKYFNGVVSKFEQEFVEMRTHKEIYGVSPEDEDEDFQAVYG